MVGAVPGGLPSLTIPSASVDDLGRLTLGAARDRPPRVRRHERALAELRVAARRSRRPEPRARRARGREPRDGALPGLPDLEQLVADAGRRGGRRPHAADGRRRGRRDRRRPRRRHGPPREHPDGRARRGRDRRRPAADRRAGAAVAPARQPRRLRARRRLVRRRARARDPSRRRVRDRPLGDRRARAGVASLHRGARAGSGAQGLPRHAAAPGGRAGARACSSSASTRRSSSRTPRCSGTRSTRRSTPSAARSVDGRRRGRADHRRGLDGRRGARARSIAELERRGSSSRSRSSRARSRTSCGRYGLMEQIGEERFYPTIGLAVRAHVAEHGVDWRDWEDAARSAVSTNGVSGAFAAQLRVEPGRGALPDEGVGEALGAAVVDGAVARRRGRRRPSRSASRCVMPATFASGSCGSWPPTSDERRDDRRHAPVGARNVGRTGASSSRPPLRSAPHATIVGPR